MFEIELFICIKMNLALITYSGWCAIKPNQTNNNSTTNNNNNTTTTANNNNNTDDDAF